MSIANISNGEAGSSVRTKLNTVIEDTNELNDSSKFLQIQALKNIPIDYATGMLTAWDSFIRDPQNNISIVDGVTTNSNGIAYNLLDGATGNINALPTVRLGKFNGFVGLNANSILNTATGLVAGFNAKILVNARSAGDRTGLIIYVDANNWYRISVSSSTLYVDERAAGVTTNLITQSLGVTLLRTIQRIQIDYTSQQNSIQILHENTGLAINPTNPSIITDGIDINQIAFDGDFNAYRINKQSQI